MNDKRNLEKFLNQINETDIDAGYLYQNDLHFYRPEDFNKSQLYDIQYLKIAKVWSENSYSTRAKVGAIMVKDKTIISDGFNGMPKDFPNECEDSLGNTNIEVLHAEANCITKVAKSNNSSKNATLYCTMSPCIDCAKLIIQSEISEVVFCNLYRTTEGLHLLYDYGNCAIKYYKLF